MIARCDEPKGLSLVLADFKSYTAKKILEIVYSSKESRKDWMIHVFKFYAKLRKGHQEHMVWEPGSHPIHLWSKKVILQKLNYIHRNPVAAGMVELPEHYLYSSASNYQKAHLPEKQFNCKLEIDLLEGIWNDEGFALMGR